MLDAFELLSHTPFFSKWKEIGIHPHHGINLPLSALHSKHSCGIGEFYDLLPLIDWCAEIHFDVIQLLPLNDSGEDPSPYFIVSAFALNPVFLSLHKLPDVDPFDSELSALKSFTTTPKVAYSLVSKHKMLFLQNYFDQKAEIVLKNKDFSYFVEQNSWVKPYALFKTLKHLHKGLPWHLWPPEHQFSSSLFNTLLEQHFPALSFHLFLQYLCFKQLREVSLYARARGVLLKGDMPLLISPDSADVWQHAQEFDLSHSAGAPPDFYHPEGQAWGLALFNWEAMEARKYDWWKQRIGYASQFYTLYRIDHAVGFFRIWSIPENRSEERNACLGAFLPKEEALWIPQGKKILSALLEGSSILPIAEDLGTIPPLVRPALHELGICTTKVMRWERNTTPPYSFIEPTHYHPLSMTTVSTHDSETLALWWTEQKEQASAFAAYKGWQYAPYLTPSQRKELLWDSHRSSSLFHVNLLGEYLALFPELVAEDPKEERINVPGKVLPENWTYRIRPNVEELIAHEALKNQMRFYSKNH